MFAGESVLGVSELSRLMTETSCVRSYTHNRLDRMHREPPLARVLVSKLVLARRVLR